MNLSKDETNPARALKWAGKSLAICSRKELIDCIVAQARMLGQQKSQLDAILSKLNEVPAKADEHAG